MNSAPPPSSGPRVTREQVRDLTRLRRSRDGRLVAGVCEGLSRHLDIDPLLIRVIFGALTVFGGAGLVLYAIAWLTIPADDSYESVTSRALHRDPERTMVLGLSIAAIAGALTLLGAIGFATPRPWAVITVSLIGLVLFTLFSRRGASHPHPPTPPAGASPQPPAAESAGTPYGPTASDSPYDQDSADSTDAAAADVDGSAVPGEVEGDTTTVLPATSPPGDDTETKAWWQRDVPPSGPSRPEVPAAPPPRPPGKGDKSRSRLTPIALAVMALALGGIWAADVAGADIYPSVYPGTVLAITAAALLLGTWYGRAKLLIPIGLVAALLTAVATVIGPGPHGERIYMPTTASAVKQHYEHGAGRIIVNLEDVSDVADLDGRTIDIDSHVGLLQVVVPTTVDAQVTAHIDAGDINGPAVSEDADNGSQRAVMTARHDGRPLVTINTDLTFGQIEVFRFDCPDVAIARRGDTAQQDLSTLTWEGDDRDPAACH
jgi:phage shock protein PspC (stress-responsive transcriptional regulator)